MPPSLRLALAVALLAVLAGCTVYEHTTSGPSSGGSIAPSGSASGSIGASR